jgi:S-DNA-T family DNA segregation ATPase FtsK/SpoIIIE
MASVRTGSRAPGAGGRAGRGSAGSRGTRDQAEPPAARRTAKRTRDERRRKVRRELAAIVCAALAALLFFVLYAGWNGGYVGSWLATALRFLVGLLAFLGPMLLVYAAVLLATSEERRPARVVTAGVIVLCAAFVLAAAADTFGLFGGERSAALYRTAYMTSHGGVVGETLWAATRPLLGGVGVTILVVAATVAGVLLVTGSSLGLWATHSRRGAAAAARAARSSAESLAERGRASQERLQQRTALLSQREGGDAASAATGAAAFGAGRSTDDTVSRTRLIDAATDLPDLYEAPGLLGATPVGHVEPPNPIRIPLDDEPGAHGEGSGEHDAAGEGAGDAGEAAGEAGTTFAEAEERVWVLPDPFLLRRMGDGEGESRTSIEQVSATLEQTLGHFGIEARVVNTVSGPRVTRYELQLAPGIKVSRVSSLKDDLAYSLAATEIRVQAPIPGKQAVGVEVPNRNPNFVGLGDIYGAFPTNASPMAFWIGKDITGKPVLADLVRMVHVLIAGTTGSGKSGCINCIISSVLLRATPDQVRMILVDPKKVELSHFDGVPHLLAPVVTNMKNAHHVLQNLVHEMEHRYEFMMRTDNAQNVRELNKKLERRGEKPLPYIVLVIDELADLMMVSPAEVEDAIIRLGQLGRGVGIHLVVATQRPSVDVITGLIKTNIPSRIAFAVSSQTDSRVILDTGGAESLLGDGDMLFHPFGSSRMLRVQGAFVTPEEMKLITGHWKTQASPEFREDLLEVPGEGLGEGGPAGSDEDELLGEAITTVVNTGAASVALLQRRLRVGYARAGRLIDIMEGRGIISGYDGSKARNVLISEDELPRVLAALRGEPLAAEAEPLPVTGEALPPNGGDALAGGARDTSEEPL